METKDNITEDEMDLIMQLSPAYLQRREEILREGEERGEEKGRQEGLRLFVETVLRARFGTVDAELSRVIEPLLELPLEECAGLLLQFSQLSREKLIARFGRSAS